MTTTRAYPFSLVMFSAGRPLSSQIRAMERLKRHVFFFLLLFRFFSFFFVFFSPLFPFITLSVCSRIVPTGFVLGCLASAGSLRRSDAMWEQAVDACDLFTPPA